MGYTVKQPCGKRHARCKVCAPDGAWNFQGGNKFGYRFQRGYDPRRHRHRLGSQTGPNSGAWKGGVSHDKEGRALIRCLQHPHAQRSGYVLRSRLVWELTYGHFLPPWFVVHHVNGDPTDDRPANLWALLPKEHARLHAWQRG